LALVKVLAAFAIDDFRHIVILMMTCIDMKRLPASGRVIVTGPASRSNRAEE